MDTHLNRQMYGAMFAAPNNFVSLACSSMLLPVDVLAPPFEYFTASSTHEHELYYRCLLVSGFSSAEVETRVEGAIWDFLSFGAMEWFMWDWERVPCLAWGPAVPMSVSNGP